MYRSGFARTSSAAVAVLLAAATSWACLDIGGPRLTPTLTASPVESGVGQPFDVTGGVGFVRFTGSILTDNNCQKITAQLDRFSENQAILELGVVAETLDGCPNSEEATWNYVGQLIDTPAGTFDVTVEHRFRNSNRSSEVVFEGSVTIREP